MKCLKTYKLSNLKQHLNVKNEYKKVANFATFLYSLKGTVNTSGSIKPTCRILVYKIKSFSEGRIVLN
ncbi:hypothetical protein GCM10022393_33660 [Aquimarina addita]|uniref:Uncharacterized protein n=1 Tax=Aquimarina addita TaxID=870485 RepID=A0ABP6UPJ9_9FLAO